MLLQRAKRIGLGSIRIIGGKWRGRTINVVEIPHLRPTPDRIRETLFNWLQPFIVDAACVDLFAGTGALSFEALSRGAKEVVLVESNRTAFDALTATATRLEALDSSKIVLSEADVWLTKVKSGSTAVDIIFLDPPFSSDQLSTMIDRLKEHPLVSTGTLIYIESDTLFSEENLPHQWNIIKQKKAGDVFFHLIKVGH